MKAIAGVLRERGSVICCSCGISVPDNCLEFFVFDFVDKLDGIRPMKSKRRREESPPPALSDEDDPYDEREEDMRIGKKRVC